MIGSWLFITDSYFFCHQNILIQLIMALLFLITHPFFIITLLINIKKRWNIMGAIKRTLFEYHSQKIFDLYTSTFSQVAKEKKVWIVAGSCILPRVKLSNTNLGVSNKNTGLYNISMVFNPNGKVVNVIFKHHLVAEELEFLDQGEIDEIQPLEIPNIGKLGVLVCADSWYSKSYTHLMSCDVIASVSMVTPENVWFEVWKGYSGFPNEKEVEERDIGRICENEAWLKYALPGRTKFLKKCNAKIILSCHFQGKIFFMNFGGQSFIQYNNNLNQAKYHEDTVLTLEI